MSIAYCVWTERRRPPPCGREDAGASGGRNGEAEMALPKWQVEKDVYTEDEYFAFEQESFGRWEFVDGEIRAMAGGVDDHNAIAANIVRVLGTAVVPRGCRVYGSDMKV